MAILSDGNNNKLIIYMGAIIALLLGLHLTVLRAQPSQV